MAVDYCWVINVTFPHPKIFNFGYVNFLTTKNLPPVGGIRAEVIGSSPLIIIIKAAEW